MLLFFGSRTWDSVHEWAKIAYIEQVANANNSQYTLYYCKGRKIWIVVFLIVLFFTCMLLFFCRHTWDSAQEWATIAAVEQVANANDSQSMIYDWQGRKISQNVNYVGSSSPLSKGSEHMKRTEKQLHFCNCQINLTCNS